MNDLQKKVFLDRYALKDKDGKLLEQTPQEMWQRVAGGIAKQEKAKDKEKWQEEFYRVMEDFKFVPGGRILSGAGTNYQVTYFNCFVIPSPKDSREGILEALKQLVEIQSRSGGVGLNLSSLRPRGARVRKVNGTSSGPVTWAGLFSYATHDVVQQGGTRRGATMLMLWDWHPDVEEFITVKQDLSKINGANLSVCISDSFMEAVKADKDWHLVYPDIDDPEYDAKWDGELDKWVELGKKVKVYKTVKARELWNKICEAAWRSAEPGLHFMERSNKRSNTRYFERLIATNPCLPSDTWIHTSSGPRQIRDLIGQQFIARVNGQNYVSGLKGFFKTGTKQLLKLQTKEGYTLRLTGDHKIQRATRFTRYTREAEWVEAQDLRSGDRIILHEHRENTSWQGSYTWNDGYLIGLLLGDGTLKHDKAVLSVWDTPLSGSEGTKAVMQGVLHAASSVGHRSDFAGWMDVPARREHRLVLSYVKQLANELGMRSRAKLLTKNIEEASSDFYRGFLRGLFDADGSVQGTQAKGISVRLAQSDISTLEGVQRMLLRLGIASRLYKNRRKQGVRMLPNSKRVKAEYMTKAQHELVISGENLLPFSLLIGFGNTDKSARLEKLLRSYSRSLNRERFTATVEAVALDGIEEVFDATIADVHAFDANGMYVHNCGEQPLGAWAVCNLGAMNLSAYVKGDDLAGDKPGKFDFASFGKDVRTAMRMLDNVIDQTYYFFSENEKCAKEIRRTGLGIMGLGDALIKMHVKYGSDESLPVIKKIFETLRDNAYEASSDIAKEKGAFPKFDKKLYMEGYHIKALPASLQKKIAKQGIRNAVLLTIAPTGTTSLISGVSSGVEPVYEFAFIRRDRIGEHTIYHPLFDAWKKAHPTAEKPEYFVSANDLTPLEHVRVQAVAQEYIDSSISKTVNAPNKHTVEDVKTLYLAAYEYGLKGITYMRDGSRQGVLERVVEKKKEEVKESTQQALPIIPVIPRPKRIEGVTYQAETPMGKTYITINHTDDKEPFEVFVTIGKSGSDVSAMADALGRMISLNLRQNGMLPPRERIRQVVSQLHGIGGARSIGFGPNRVRSFPDAIARVLSTHFGFHVNGKVVDTKPQEKAEATNGHATNGNGLHNGHSAKDTSSDTPEQAHPNQLTLASPSGSQQATSHLFDICPECGTGSFAYEEGCKKCYSCGYSEC